MSNQKRVLRGLKNVMSLANIQDLFAFFNKERYESGNYMTEEEPWDWSLYSVESEFARMQLKKDEWRITNSNEVGQLSSGWTSKYTNSWSTLAGICALSHLSSPIYCTHPSRGCISHQFCSNKRAGVCRPFLLAILLILLC